MLPPVRRLHHLCDARSSGRLSSVSVRFLVTCSSSLVARSSILASQPVDGVEAPLARGAFGVSLLPRFEVFRGARFAAELTALDMIGLLWFTASTSTLALTKAPQSARRALFMSGSAASP